MATERKYEQVKSFSFGFACVKDKLWGVIDKNFETVIACQYDDIRPLDEILFAAKKGDKWGVVNIHNKIEIPFEYEMIGELSDGLIRVQKNGKWGYIDRRNEEVLPFEYDDAHDFNFGMAVVTIHNKIGVINQQGHYIASSECFSMSVEKNGLIKVTELDMTTFYYLNKYGDNIMVYM